MIADHQQATLKDLGGFMLGRRESIVRLVNAKHRLWFAGGLVFTAALAREYDSVSLLHRPWELLGSFAASLALCTGLFFAVSCCLAMSKIEVAEPMQEFKKFLAGYWLTAPLAWLYALPVEALTSEISALRFQLDRALDCFLVARRTLFSRVVAIQFRVPYLVALVWILLPCMVVVFAVLINAVMPMIAIMGGLRLTQAQTIVRDYQSSVLGLLFYGAIPVLLAWCAGFVFARRHRAAPGTDDHRRLRLSRDVWIGVAVPLALLALGCLYFQPKLERSWQIDQLLYANRLDDAVAMMQTLEERQLPRNWDPPPKFPSRSVPKPDIVELAQAIGRNGVPTWIVDRLMSQSDEIMMRQFDWFQGTGNLSYLESSLWTMKPEELEAMRDGMIVIAELETSEASEKAQRDRVLKIIEESIPKSRDNLKHMQSMDSEIEKAEPDSQKADLEAAAASESRSDDAVIDSRRQAAP